MTMRGSDRDSDDRGHVACGHGSEDGKDPPVETEPEGGAPTGEQKVGGPEGRSGERRREPERAEGAETRGAEPGAPDTPLPTPPARVSVEGRGARAFGCPSGRPGVWHGVSGLDVYSSEVREPFKPRRPALRDRAAGSCPRPPARGAQREPRPETRPGTDGAWGRAARAEEGGGGRWGGGRGLPRRERWPRGLSRGGQVGPSPPPAPALGAGAAAEGAWVPWGSDEERTRPAALPKTPGAGRSLAPPPAARPPPELL